MLILRRLICGLGFVVVTDLSSVNCWAQAGDVQKTWMLEEPKDLAQGQSPPSLTVTGKSLSGTTGCNSFSATLQSQPDGRTFVTEFNATRILCSSERERIETAIFQALQATVFTEANGNSLRFLNSERQPLLTWKSAS
ncbi:META domain-containing protein [Bradyrhizobium elkanii]|uniref:META domain-containing protein n=1 Tax=Bradyrhizobium elkanii TaxID=29448 RepID=UPI002012E8F6|nr:META domain-containing protein [Bradyrhizobium elkanii]